VFIVLAVRTIAFGIFFYVFVSNVPYVEVVMVIIHPVSSGPAVTPPSRTGGYRIYPFFVVVAQRTQISYVWVFLMLH